MLCLANERSGELKLTRLGEAEAVDSLREIVHTDVFGFAAILEELLCRETHSMIHTDVQSYDRGAQLDRVTDY